MNYECGNIRLGLCVVNYERPPPCSHYSFEKQPFLRDTLQKDINYPRLSIYINISSRCKH